ncbi:hypothetical protein CA223_16620 [Sphingomonas koreensis]|nr:hypothetical protein CA224_20880 [Sphingomonas koreensis]RSU19966.1 hypothetical protein CA222_21800 [Sphingomonas koreensis]RSU26132.1 hypothetical protein CA225_13920 [Sphingomonas koreensis]RSU29447.1 hypothetical protein BRX39_20515 [Sphingomonas koreensis]RSU36040.1 hypothetical protein CA223_16620 [Sphingomonas koreensis]
MAALTACGEGSGEGNGASILVKSGEGEASIRADKDGRVAVKAPGFEGSIKLPKFDLGADNFEVDGLKLYPGSTIASLNVDANQDKGGEDSVRVQFDAPAAADKVRNWFQEQMQTAGFTVAAKDGQLSGKTSEGSDFTLDIDAAGGSKSRGTLTVLGK